MFVHCHLCLTTTYYLLIKGVTNLSSLTQFNPNTYLKTRRMNLFSLLETAFSICLACSLISCRLCKSASLLLSPASGPGGLSALFISTSFSTKTIFAGINLNNYQDYPQMILQNCFFWRVVLFFVWLGLSKMSLSLSNVKVQLIWLTLNKELSLSDTFS